MVVFTGKNKRVGKQLASQKILQLLHPHVKNWGSLLRMYGRESSKMVKQVKMISFVIYVVIVFFYVLLLVFNLIRKKTVVASISASSFCSL